MSRCYEGVKPGAMQDMDFRTLDGPEMNLG